LSSVVTTKSARAARLGRLLCLGACLTGGLTGGTATAQSLHDLYVQALAQDPAVAGAEAQVRAAEERQVQARAAFGPSAAVVGNYGDTRYREAPAYEQRRFYEKKLNVQVTQPLLRSALLPALDSSAAQVQQARAMLEQARTDTGQRLVEACFEVLKARDALELVRAQRVATAEQLTLAQKSFKTGTAPVIDVRDAEAKADAVAAQVSAAEFELDLRLQVVTELTGQNATDLLGRGLDGKQLPPLQADDTSQWFTAAQENNAQLRSARQALASAEQLAPCVLWMDEIEKGLASGGEDGGVSRRVLGYLLTWMAERKAPVFISGFRLSSAARWFL